MLAASIYACGQSNNPRSLKRENGVLFLYTKVRYHNSNHMLELDLQKLGLNEKEVKVYLAALELGYAPVQNIAKKAGINRATTYFIIDGLLNRGLMTQIEKDKKTYYAAEDPRGLEVIIDKKIKDAEEAKGIFKEVLPQLESIYNLSAEKPKVRYYEGLEGIQAMRAEFIEVAQKEILGFVSLDQLLKYFPAQETELTQKRIKKGIKSRVIYTREAGPVEKGTDQAALREARYVPKSKINLVTDVSIYGNRVSMVFLKEKMGGVIIENNELADTMRAIFELAWEGAEKYQKE